MKAILTLITVLIFGATALANTDNDVQINTLKMDVVLVNSIDHAGPFEKIKVDTKNGITRLYKSQDSRVKKALSFVTKKSSAIKLA